MQDVADVAGVDFTYISKLEGGYVKQPKPEVLHGLAAALEVPAEDLFALVGYQVPEALPSFAPYLRAKYAMNSEALADMDDYLRFIQTKYNLSTDGPAVGEDEE